MSPLPVATQRSSKMQCLVILVAICLAAVAGVPGGGGGGGSSGSLETGNGKLWNDNNRPSSKLNKFFQWEQQEVMMKEKFTAWCATHGECAEFTFKHWKDWLKKDSFFYCRKHEDCKWMDQKLTCQEFEMRPDPNSDWFGWNKAAMQGECDCPDHYVWAEETLSCHNEMLHGKDIAIIVVCCILSVGLIFILGLECYKRL